MIPTGPQGRRSVTIASTLPHGILGCAERVLSDKPEHIDFNPVIPAYSSTDTDDELDLLIELSKRDYIIIRLTHPEGNR